MGKTDISVLKIRTFGFTYKAKLENNVTSSLKLKCSFLFFLINFYFLHAFRTVRFLSLPVAPKRYVTFYLMILEKYPTAYFDYYNHLQILIEISRVQTKKCYYLIMLTCYKLYLNKTDTLTTVTEL